MQVTHDDFILNQTLVLAPEPVRASGFVPLLIDSGTEFTDTGDGQGDFERLRVFTSVEEAEGDAELSAFGKKAVQGAFAQSPTPAEVWVAGLDSSDVEDVYVTALDDVRSSRYVSAFTIDSRAPADVVTTATAAGARKIQFFAQMTDDDEISDPTSYAGIDTPWCIILFHDGTNEPEDFKWLARLFAYDPDRYSRNYQTQVRGVSGYTTEVDSTDYSDALNNNINLVLPFGPADSYVSPGRAFDGRPGSELLSTQWYALRMKERLVRLWLAKDQAGEKIPVGLEGQAIVEGEYRAQFQTGVGLGHFVAGQLLIEKPAISDTDIDEQNIPINVFIQYETGAVQITSSVTFSRVPVIEEE